MRGVRFLRPGRITFWTAAFTKAVIEDFLGGPSCSPFSWPFSSYFSPWRSFSSWMGGGGTELFRLLVSRLGSRGPCYRLFRTFAIGTQERTLDICRRDTRR